PDCPGPFFDRCVDSSTPGNPEAQGCAKRIVGRGNSSPAATDDLYRDRIFQSCTRGLSGSVPPEYCGRHEGNGSGPFPHRDSQEKGGNAPGGPAGLPPSGRRRELVRTTAGSNAPWAVERLRCLFSGIPADSPAPVPAVLTGCTVGQLPDWRAQLTFAPRGILWWMKAKEFGLNRCPANCRDR